MINIQYTVQLAKPYIIDRYLKFKTVNGGLFIGGLVVFLLPLVVAVLIFSNIIKPQQLSSHQFSYAVNERATMTDTILVKNSQLRQPAAATTAEDVYFTDQQNPVHLNISSVNIDYPVELVGLTGNQEVQTPEPGKEVVGWYKFGPTPGEKGTSVIVGHVNSYTGPSVFTDLKDVAVGQAVTVTRSDNSKAVFKVNSVETFKQDSDFPSERVYSHTDNASLRLITCEGSYDSGTERFTHNTVVFASLVGLQR